MATIDLCVVSPARRDANEPLPLRAMVQIEEGDIIRYRPLLRPHEVRKGEVTLVLVPTGNKNKDQNKLLVSIPAPPLSRSNGKFPGAPRWSPLSMARPA